MTPTSRVGNVAAEANEARLLPPTQQRRGNSPGKAATGNMVLVLEMIQWQRGRKKGQKTRPAKKVRCSRWVLADLFRKPMGPVQHYRDAYFADDQLVRPRV